MVKFVSIKTKLLFSFVVFLVIITVFNIVLTSYVINRQGEEEAFSQLSRQLKNFKNDLEDIRENRIAVSMEAAGDEKNLSDLAVLYSQSLKFRQQPGIALERTLSLNRTTSLNRLGLVLDSANLSSIAVYLDNKLSHYVTQQKVGILTQPAGQETYVSSSRENSEKAPYTNWRNWSEATPPKFIEPVMPVTDRVAVTFEFPSTALMVLRIVVPVQGVLRKAFLETIAEHLKISDSTPSTLQNGDQKPQVIGMFVFCQTFDAAFLRNIADQTGVIPAIFSPDQQHAYYLSDLGRIPPEFPSDLSSGSIQTRTFSLDDLSFYQAFATWQIDGKPLLHLGGTLSRERTVATIEQTMTSIVSAAVLFALIAGTFGYLVLSRMIAPISLLTVAVSGIGLDSSQKKKFVEQEITLRNSLGRYLDQKITVNSHDEISALTSAFNIMARQLYELIGSLEMQVTARTEELVEINRRLEEEIVEREQIQLELAKARDELEIRVQERTSDLTSSNEKLRNEISERKRVENKLRQTSEELQRIIASISDCVWSAEVDEEGNWTYSYYSPVVEQITGRPPAYFQHNPDRWLNMIHQNDRPRLLDVFQRIMNGQAERVEEEYRIIRTDGELCWVRDCAIITQLGTRQQIHRVIGDITARKQAEGEIQRLNRDLEQRVKDRTVQLETANKELESFAYSVSHDLRAPLRHIDGYVQMLRTRIDESLDTKGQHYMDNIRKAANRMGMLIDDLLEFSRMGRHGMSSMKVDLNEIVRDVVQEMEPDIVNRNIHWRIAELPSVMGDQAMLRMVLVNLIGNAVKFTQPRDQAEIEIGCQFNQTKTVVVFIRDNGVGFDMQYADKLFGVFQRLHRIDDFEGTGIGLASVQRIISRHGGRTWAEGEVDRGATFYFELPL